MKSPVGWMAAVAAALLACSGTASMSRADTGEVVDATDAADAADAPDVGVLDAVDVGALDVARDDGAAADVARDDGAAADVGLRCDAPQTACESAADRVCVDVRSDPRHCGACGRACCAGEWCAAGTCVVGCSPGVTACRPTGSACGICIDLRISPDHCGACNRACAAGEVCSNGACAAAPACAAVTEPAAPMGQCDGRGRIACEMWAQGIAGGRPSVTAQCLTEPSGCAKADRCDDPRDASTCRCGAEPACGPNQVCELVGPTARCRCARP